jgi:hypothetical protein
MIPVILAAILLMLVANRYCYGVWNPFQAPDRIECYGRRYYMSSIKELADKEKPEYLIKSIHLLTGKMLYSMERRGEYVPTVIYLYKGNNRYLSYALSGGP